MTIVMLADNRMRRRGGVSVKRPKRRRRSHSLWLIMAAAFTAQQFIQWARLVGTSGGGGAMDSGAPVPGARRKLEPCRSIDTAALGKGLVCLERCRPSGNSTIGGLGRDPNERVKISMPVDQGLPRLSADFGRHRVYFPEEDVHVNLTGGLSDEVALATEDAARAGEDSIVDRGYLHPRSITERLLRRVVAKLLKAGVLDPSKDIVNTGSWIGDNALPWALMMDRLRPESPGRVVAIDPSPDFVRVMAELAQVNGVGNLCAQAGILSSKTERVAMFGVTEKRTEHIKVHTLESIEGGSRVRKARCQQRCTWFDAVTLDSLGLRDGVSLLHLDVEGHEGEVLQGARRTIVSSRPIVITEGYDMWPEPKDANDRHAWFVLTSLGYSSADLIPEYCGVKEHARNRIWWPDHKTRDAAMAVVGRDLEREGVAPWVSVELPEVG